MGFRFTAGAIAFVACVWMSPQGAVVKPKNLPPGVLNALVEDENNYCEQFLGDFRRGCREEFRRNLSWLELEIAPSERAAILVENRNAWACGSGGCSLYLFVQQPDARFVQVLGMNGEMGTLKEIKVLKDITKGHYNIQKTWHDGKTRTLYRWDGQRYSAGQVNSG
jgi:hypothetical protein